jgi:Flp pilus assembly pilin Flp
MQDISIRTAVAVQNLVHRLREERGQTAIEYVGILVLLALVFAALIAADIDGQIEKKVGPAVKDILKGGN